MPCNATSGTTKTASKLFVPCTAVCVLHERAEFSLLAGSQAILSLKRWYLIVHTCVVSKSLVHYQRKFMQGCQQASMVK